MKIKQMFCNHTFMDLGCYNDELLRCTKCGREKIKVVQNEKHPLYREWKWLDNG